MFDLLCLAGFAWLALPCLLSMASSSSQGGASLPSGASPPVGFSPPYWWVDGSSLDSLACWVGKIWLQASHFGDQHESPTAQLGLRKSVADLVLLVAMEGCHPFAHREWEEAGSWLSGVLWPARLAGQPPIR